MPSSRGPAAVAVAAFEGMELIEARGSIDALDMFNSGCVCVDGIELVCAGAPSIDWDGGGEWRMAPSEVQRGSRRKVKLASTLARRSTCWSACSSPQPQRPSWVDAKGGQPTDPMAWPLDRTTTVHMRAMRWTRPGMACVVNRKHSLNESIISDN